MAIFLSVISCQNRPQSSVPSNREWAAYQKDFFAELWALFPASASAVGLHEFDGQLKVPTAHRQEEIRGFYKKYLGRLGQIDKNVLHSSEAMDYELVKNYLEGSAWEQDVLKAQEWNPQTYNIGNTLAVVLEGGTTGEAQKLKAMAQKLAVVPEYYEAAIKNIKKPTREHLEFAIKQIGSLPDYLKGDVKRRFEASSLSVAEKTDAALKIDAAIKAANTFVDKLQAMRNKLEKTKGFRSFRLGRELYAQKFVYDLQASHTADEIFKKAIEQKASTHAEMIKIADELWPKYFPKQKKPAQKLSMVKKLLEKISQNHIKPAEFLPTIEKQIPQLWDFVVKKNLLTLDPKKKLKVRATPVYERGFAGASVDSPGPFDADRETFYNVTPLDGMPPEKQESYLREYNNYTLQILNIHEAIPGHYVQLVYSLKSPSLIKQVFGSGTMIEGWAVYGERMMLEAGYGNNEPEMWLMYHKWRLRVICNTILDYSLHNLNMSKTEALKLLIGEAFQETAEAAEKWNRATYSQVQLASYFTGFTEIYEFREELKKAQGSKFNLKAFNEKFLSYGSAPIKFIKEDMRKEWL